MARPIPSSLALGVAVALAVGLLGGCGGSPAPAASATTAATTTSTIPPTTTTTLGIPPDLQSSAAAAAQTLVNAWAEGNQAAGLTVATPAAVASLFAQPYSSADAVNRGCSVAFPPLVCTFGTEGGGNSSEPLIEITVSQSGSEWYVSSVDVETEPLVTYRRVAEAREAIDQLRADGSRVGLVPTMGALHAGHFSLIERAAAENDAVVVTVFVNPLQFGAPEDLAGYPRQPEADLAAAARAGATHAFIPTVAEMYPEGFATGVHVAGLTDVLEGAARPGHYDGVTTVVTKLFVLAGRSRAYFGEKDFQQLLVVRRLAADLGLPVEVVGCPTVREADGLALSSRNARLSSPERAAAPVLARALRAGAEAVAAGMVDPPAISAVMAGVVAEQPLVGLDYAELVDSATLRRPVLGSGPWRLLIAARLGPTRLIDNWPAYHR